MDASVYQWLNLLIRWLHLVAVIGWIGSSFYFIALDYSLLPPKLKRDAERGVSGESWEIHGGGFYRVEKFKVAPEHLPEPLHWFKWEAYTTWLSGFALLVVLYYANAQAYLIDRSVAAIEPWQAVALSVGLLALGWVVYDRLCRALEGRDLLLAAALLLVIVAAAYGTSRIFAPRAAYIQVGAMMGTWMAANVFFVIIPGHRELVAAKLAGKEPDPRPGILGKQRSVHNNYLTLPVLFAMISNHFPMTFGHPYAWAILVAIMVISVSVRHFFNLRHQGRTIWAIPLGTGATTALLAIAIATNGPSTQRDPTRAVGKADFSAAQQVIAQRCQSCHSAHPTNPTFTVAPAGVMFDTPEQIGQLAPRIYQQAVMAKAMPLGNLTNMTQEERDTLAAWIERGAAIN